MLKTCQTCMRLMAKVGNTSNRLRGLLVGQMRQHARTHGIPLYNPEKFWTYYALLMHDTKRARSIFIRASSHMSPTERRATIKHENATVAFYGHRRHIDNTPTLLSVAL